MNIETLENLFEDMYINYKFIESVSPVKFAEKLKCYYFSIGMVSGDGFFSRDFETKEECEKVRQELIEFINPLSKWEN